MGNILIVSGAGLSAESGIPTFRDANGLWENHRVEEVANFLTWEENYDLVHRFYNQRRVDLGTVQPNDAHAIYARLASLLPVRHFTQNIDDLLERAGHPTTQDDTSPLIHLHGYLTEMVCGCCAQRWNIGYSPYDVAVNPCPNGCGNVMVKPNVVFFHERAPQYANMTKAVRDLTEDDIVVVVGTMGEVLPINSMFFDAPGFKILNNLEANKNIDDSLFDKVFYQPATEAAPLILDIIQERFSA